PDPEQVRLHPVRGARHDPGQRLATELLGALLVADEESGRAVVERRRVAGRDGAVLTEDRLELPELLHRAVRADALVALELGIRYRHDLAVVHAFVPRRRGALVALQRELLLLLTRDLEVLGQDLGAPAERHPPLLGHVR